MEAGTVAFEDIHAVAVRLAARRLGPAQKRVADREARRLSRTIRARRAEVKAQLQRITFIDEAAKLVGDDCFGFHLAMETNTRELGIIHYILSASDNALDATHNSWKELDGLRRFAGNKRLVPSLAVRGAPNAWCPQMRTRRKTYQLSEWRLTTEQIGRGLQELYSTPDRLPPRLRALLTELERTSAMTMRRRRKPAEAKR
jgi:hypothetical protein